MEATRNQNAEIEPMKNLIMAVIKKAAEDWKRTQYKTECDFFLSAFSNLPRYILKKHKENV